MFVLPSRLLTLIVAGAVPMLMPIGATAATYSIVRTFPFGDSDTGLGFEHTDTGNVAAELRAVGSNNTALIYDTVNQRIVTILSNGSVGKILGAGPGDVGPAMDLVVPENHEMSSCGLSFRCSRSLGDRQNSAIAGMAVEATLRKADEAAAGACETVLCRSAGTQRLSYSLGPLVIQAARRSYLWCRPPSCSISTTRPDPLV